MNITVKSTGNTYQVDPINIAQMLLEAFPDRFTVYQAPAQVPNAPQAPKWIVGEHLGNGKITIVVSVGDNSQEFNERPKQAATAFKARGFDLPNEILQRYVALRKAALENVKRDIAAIRGSKENSADIGQMLTFKLSSLMDAGYGEDA